MKKFFLFSAMLLFFCGCDDGDLEVVSFDFAGVSAKSCNLQNFFVYTIKGNRTFILQIDESNFKNEITAPNTPIKIPISGTTRVLYREYSGPISETTLCSSPPEADLVKTKEWNATGGVVEITTIAVFDENATTNASSITGYSHTIVFKNIAFFTGDSEQKNDLIDFGVYARTNSNRLAVDQAINPSICGTDKKFLFKFFGNQSLTLNVDDAIFNTTILNTPKIQTLNATTNKLIFRVLSTGNVVLTNNYFCATGITPFQNIEEWVSQPTTGSIQVITEDNAPNGFKHTIKLLNTTMEGQNLKFRLGNEYLFGVYSQL